VRQRKNKVPRTKPSNATTIITTTTNTQSPVDHEELAAAFDVVLTVTVEVTDSRETGDVHDNSVKDAAAIKLSIKTSFFIYRTSNILSPGLYINILLLF